MTIIPSFETVVGSTVLYFIVRIIAWALKQSGLRFQKELRNQRDFIIHMHIKDGHGGRLKDCRHVACLSLRMPVPVPLLVQESTELQEQAARTV
jgi:hypothetical protein